jgi:hypothetical protein
MSTAHGQSQRRPSQHGPSQHGPSQHGPSQHGPSQRRWPLWVSLGVGVAWSLATVAPWAIAPAQALKAVRRAGRGASIRGGTCQPQQAQPLLSLLPLYQTDQGQVLAVGTTQATHPTLWLHLPYPITPQHPAELRREDPDPADPAYRQLRTVARITEAPAGIIGLRLPTTEPPLRPNQLTDFQFVVQCDAQDPSSNQVITFSLMRQVPGVSIQEALRRQSAGDRLRMYQNLGFWQDAVSTLATLRQQNPSDRQLTTEWTLLLQQIGLEAIAPQPIHPCCDAPP